MDLRIGVLSHTILSHKLRSKRHGGMDDDVDNNENLEQISEV